MIYKEDFIEFLLKNTTYDEMSIREFADCYLQNLLTISENLTIFQKWLKSQ